MKGEILALVYLQDYKSYDYTHFFNLFN